MAELPLTLICSDYARVMPLMIGDVAPRGIRLTMLRGDQGSWTARADILRRALTDPAIDGGESSVAGHLRRIDQGDRSLVALPVFVVRGFVARDLYVRAGGPIRAAADLAGRRIGIYSFNATGSIWYRHFLRHVGVPPEGLRWWVGETDGAPANAPLADLPAGVHQPAAGRSLSDMLCNDELDAIYTPRRPALFHPAGGPLVRLFPDMRQTEAAYFRATLVFPPQHLVVLRRATWAANPWIAPSLTEAFTAANDRFTASQRVAPLASPWLDAELEETAALMGEDFHPYGLAACRAALEIFSDEAFRAGITSRRVAVDECFAEYLGSPAPA